MEVNVPTLTIINNTSDENFKFVATIKSDSENSSVTLNTNNNTGSNGSTERKKPKHIIHLSTFTITLIVSLSIIVFFHFRWKVIDKITTWNRKRRERIFYQHYCQKYPYHKFGLELEAEDGDENMDLSIFGINLRNHVENDEIIELS